MCQTGVLISDSGRINGHIIGSWDAALGIQEDLTQEREHFCPNALCPLSSRDIKREDEVEHLRWHERVTLEWHQKVTQESDTKEKT